MVTIVQQKLISLDSKKEEIKRYFEELQEALTEASKEIGVEGFFQDPISGTVFQIVKPDGRFVHYEPLNYLRTKKEGEVRGSLSVKKAEEAGFSI